MNKKLVLMFSGQGSQYYQMGKELYDKQPVFKYWMDYCDDLVWERTGVSLIHVLYGGPGKSQPFDEILYSNPALLCLEYSLTRVFQEMNITPRFLLGYSLGEITAAVVSEVITLEEGVQLVIELARLVKTRTQQAEMLVVIHSHEILNDYPDLLRNCRLTGRNFQGNFVVSGPPLDIGLLREALERRNVLSQTLPVRYGFHTNLIDPIEDDYKRLVRTFNLSPCRIPVISALTSEIVTEMDVDYFWKIIRYPVDFEKTVNGMIKTGDYTFIDAGPGGSLATFVKYILPANSRSVPLTVLNPYGRDLNAIDRLKANLSVAVFEPT